MPELPEVETLRRSLSEALLGREITGCSYLAWPRTIAAPTPDVFCELIQHRPILAVERRAKYLIMRLDRDEALVVHLRMSGQLRVQAATAERDKHTHVVFTLDDGRLLSFRDERKFGRIWLLDAAGLALLDQKLGPEPLDDQLTTAAFATVLRRRKGKIKPVLLDQSVIAGIGNIYADEALWEAQLHPARAVPTLSDAETARLHAAILTVLQRGIAHRGTTFGTYVDALGEPGTNQQHLQAYGRKGQPCVRCGTLIERMVVAQRGTYVCPVCQVVSEA